MNKLVKWLLTGVGLIVVLMLLLVFVVPKLIDPNSYKEEIQAAILEKTGRDLNIGGEIKWSIFPSVGLDLSDVSLGDESGTGDQPMIEIGEAGISVKLMPLLNRKIEVEEVKLADVSFRLQDNADGSSPGTTSRTAGGVRDPDAFVLAGIEISHANVTLNGTQQLTAFKEADLKATDIELGQPFNLKGSFTVKLLAQGITGEAQFSGLFRLAKSRKHFGIEGLKLVVKGNQGGDNNSKPLDMTINTNANIDLDADQVTLSGLNLKLHGLAVSGNLKVTSASSDPTYTGRLRLSEFNPKSLMNAMGMEAPRTNNESSLTKLQAQMDFTGSSSGVNMQNMTARLDQSSIRGNLKMDGFDRPHLAFNLQIDSLNVDDYRTGSDPRTGESNNTVDDFRAFTGGGDLSIGKLIVAGLTATEAKLTVKSQDNVIRFSPLNAKFYGGQHEGDIKIDASGSRPMLTASHGLTAVQTGSLLEDWSGSSRLQGRGDIFLQISTDLSNSRSILSSMSGDFGMSILDGEIVGIDVTDTIAAVKAALGRQTEVVGGSPQGQKTEFAEFTMSGVIQNGLVTNDDLLMQSPLLRATGEGTVNLVDESIDYLLSPVLLGDLEGLGLDELKGVPIPVKVSGNLNEPDIMVDIVAALAGSQKEMLGEKAGEFLGGLLNSDKDKGEKKQD